MSFNIIVCFWFNIYYMFFLFIVIILYKNMARPTHSIITSSLVADHVIFLKWRLKNGYKSLKSILLKFPIFFLNLLGRALRKCCTMQNINYIFFYVFLIIAERRQCGSLRYGNICWATTYETGT